MFDEDFKYTLLGGAALIGLPAALIVAGTMAFANVDIKMPSFAKADPAQEVINCYNEIIDTNNQTNCGVDVIKKLTQFEDMSADDKMKLWEDKGLTEEKAMKMAMLVAMNNACSEEGIDTIANSGPKPKDKFEQFGHDFGMKIVTGMCSKVLSEENLSKLEKIG